jgi:hypothetical protein
MEWLALGPITDDGATLLANSALPNLRTLRIHAPQLSDEGVKQLALSRTFKRLEHLYLGQSPVTDDGVRALLGSHHLRKLKSLGVRLENRIHPALRTELRERFGDPKDRPQIWPGDLSA